MVPWVCVVYTIVHGDRTQIMNPAPSCFPNQYCASATSPRPRPSSTAITNAAAVIVVVAAAVQSEQLFAKGVIHYSKQPLRAAAAAAAATSWRAALTQIQPK